MAVTRDTWPIEAVTFEDAVIFLEKRRMAKRIPASIEDKLMLGGVSDAGARILEGTHSDEDLHAYMGRLEGIFANDIQLAQGASEIIVSDYERCIAESMNEGSTYWNAVRNLNSMGDRNDVFSPEGMSGVLAAELAGKGSRKYSPLFPGMLSLMWALKVMRRPVYKSSMHDAKWAVTIGKAVNKYNAKEGIGLQLDLGQLFTYSLIHNAGALHPDISPINSDRNLGPREKPTIRRMGEKGREIAGICGFPEEPILSAVMGYRETSPSAYKSKSWCSTETSAFIGSLEAARVLEGKFYRKCYHMAKIFTPAEVFVDIELKLFEVEEIPAVRKILKNGYMYNEEQARMYPFIQPYAMLSLLFQKLERN